MASGAVEVIDLTETAKEPASASRPSSEPQSHLPRRERRRLAALERQENLPSTSVPTTTITISDDEADQTSEKPSDSSSRRKKRRRRKKDLKEDLEDGEIEVSEQDLTGSGMPVDAERITSKADGRQPEGKAEPKLKPNGSAKKTKRFNRRIPSPQLFFIDEKPDETLARLTVDEEKTSEQLKGTTELRDFGLLLPNHVHIESLSAAAHIEAPVTSETEDDDFIYFVDEDRIPTFRYYKDPSEKKQRPDLVCGHCGGEGHKTKDCNVVVCLYCGAKDEHETRNCPINKTCFSCGTKGHISKDCPDRYTTHRNGRDSFDCDRCGSRSHKSKECPTLWRLYDYVDDTTRKQILEARKRKANLTIGEGGEGFIGEDLWCYNCGEAGHLGDECQDRRPIECPRDPSAFGRYNTSIGPFAEEYISESSKRQTKRREWELEGNFDDGYGFMGPSDVGRRGRDNERERLRKRAKEIDLTQDDDDDDWFSNRDRKNKDKDRARSERNTKGRNEKRRNGPPEKKAKIDISLKSGPSKFDLAAPSDRLLSRITSPPRDRRSENEEHPRRKGDARREGEKGRRRDRERNRDRDKEKERRADKERHHKNEAHPSRQFSEHSSRRERERLTDTRKSGKDNRDEKTRQQYYGGYTR